MDHDVHLPRELREVLLAEPQRSRVDIAFEDSHLLEDIVLEPLAQLLAQAPKGRGAKHVPLEPL